MVVRKKTVFLFISSLIGSFLVVLIGIGILFLANDFSLNDYFERLPDLLNQLGRRWLFWVALCIPFLIIKLVQFWIKGFRSGGLVKFIRTIGFTFLLPITTIVLLYQWSFWFQHSENFDYAADQNVLNLTGKSQQFHVADEKIRGMHVFGRIDSANIEKLLPANIEHIVLVPYAYQEDYNTPEISFDTLRQSRRDSVYAITIEKCRKKGLELIIKPHLWITNPSEGKWRADIQMNSELAWKQWESVYESFVLHYARLSERHQLPHFCVGNEYYISTTNRPHFWRSLIKKVRGIYSGKITYGANWDREFQEITFWDDLDFIGIQSYFPLAATENPSLGMIKNGWEEHLFIIDSISKKYEKKVVFTELGYKSTPDAAMYPWGWENYLQNMVQQISLQTQTYCYQAFFDQVWRQDWMAGVMIWQWQTSDRDDDKNHNFTPEGKPAFHELAKGFALE